MTTKSQAVALDVAALIRSRNPLLWIVTREEARVERYLIEAAAAANYVPRMWDVAAGVQDASGRPVTNIGSADPDDTLKAISTRATSSALKERGIWIMRDLHAWIVGPAGATVLRNLRNLARSLPGIPRDNAQAIVVITPSSEIPPELAGHATVIEWPLPDREEIAAILDAALNALPEDLKATAAPNGVREAAIDAAVGLSGEEAAACYAKSLVQLRCIDPAAVAKEKKRVVARERVLEWYDPIPGGLDAVGGLENLKGWLQARKTAYSPAARAYGLPAPKGAMLIGVPGCLTGDTIINVCRKQRTGGHRGIRLDALFYRFNDRHLEGAEKGLYDSTKQWDLSIPTLAHCYKEDHKYIGFNGIKAVTYSGVKEVYELRTSSGTRIKATADHQFLTPNGYVKLRGLKKNDLILAYNKGRLLGDRSKGRNQTKQLKGFCRMGNHPYARRRKQYSYHPLHRLVVEAHMNNLPLEEFLWACHGDVSGLEFLSPELEVHHRDGNRDNNTISNLEALSKADHARLHLEQQNPNRYKYGARVQKVVSIKAVGKQPTYDIEMQEPYNNFVANGLVVHNCGKSLTAKAISTAWEVPLLRLDPGALKSKYVGDSEANLRKAFRVVEAIGRCVVWIDEIEKGLQGATSGSADGGVSADALGAILQWMQERPGEAFVIATANDASSLPPELLRKGRFDEIWWVDLPNLEERIQVLFAALAAHGRKGITGVNLRQVATACEAFTGSEIAAIVPEAMFVAFEDGGREIRTEDLLAAAKTVVPLSVTAEEKIKKLREWASGRARPATALEAQRADAKPILRRIDL